jgi:hypothetical protein
MAAILLGASTAGQAAHGSLLHPVRAQSSRPAPVQTTTATATATATATVSTSPPAPPGVPVLISVPSHHLVTTVTAHPFVNGAVFVPSDPKEVSWTDGEQYAAAPYDPNGTILLTSHINFIINNVDVAGAFWDLASYKVGQTVSLTMRDGRTATYRVVRAPQLLHKDWLATHPKFWAQLLDPTKSYGFPGKPHGARLVLVSCGGQLEQVQTPSGPVGDYEDNVFVELWRVS